MVDNDVNKVGVKEIKIKSEVKIKIVKEIDEYNKENKILESKIYVLKIKKEEDIKKIVEKLVEGNNEVYEEKIVYEIGEDIKELFEKKIDGDVINMKKRSYLDIKEFSGKFGVIILEEKIKGKNKIGKNVIKVKMKGNYVKKKKNKKEKK